MITTISVPRDCQRQEPSREREEPPVDQVTGSREKAGIFLAGAALGAALATLVFQSAKAGGRSHNRFDLEEVATEAAQDYLRVVPEPTLADGDLAS